MGSLCRACLVVLSKDVFYNLLLERDLAITFMEVTTLTVDIYDDFPKLLCENCYKTIINFSNFQKMCAESLKNFQEYVQEQMEAFGKNNLEMWKDMNEDEEQFFNELLNEKITEAKEEELTNESEIGNENDCELTTAATKISPLITIEPADEGIAEIFEEGTSNSYIDISNSETSNTDTSIIDTSNSSDDNGISYGNTESELKTYAVYEQQEAVTEPKNQELFTDLEEVYIVNSLEDTATSFETDIEATVILKNTFKDITKDDVDDESSEPVKKKNYHKNYTDNLRCKICLQKFYKMERFKGHMRTHQGLKPYYCLICSKDFTRSDTLDGHIKECHTLEATKTCYFDGCKNTYTTMRALQYHIKRNHAVTVEEEPSEFVCEVCGKSFKRRVFLKRHMYTHMDKSKYPFSCLHCEKRFYDKITLRDHINRHEGIKRYKCSICGQPKSTKSELRLHMNCHTNERTWACMICKKIFNNNTNLRLHCAAVHENLRAYPCKYCDQRFAKLTTLRNHEMRHTGERPHKCNFCGDTFLQISALNKHIKALHRDTYDLLNLSENEAMKNMRTHIE